MCIKIKLNSIFNFKWHSLFLLISLFFTILTLCLSSLSFYPSIENHQANLSLRRIRASSLSSIFTTNPGKAFSFGELESLGFSQEELEAQLNQLVANKELIEIYVDPEQAGKDYQGNIYLLPRRNIVSQDLIQVINSINSDRLDLPQVKYFTYTRSIRQFKQDLRFITELWKEYYELVAGVGNFEKFTGYFLPKAIHIIGDDLEMLVSGLSYTWDRFFSRVDSHILLSEEKVDKFFTDELQGLEQNIRLRQEYAQEHNIPQKLEKIISELRDTLPSLITIGKELYGDNLLGIAIAGSLARGNFYQNTDLDFLSISEEGISVEFTLKLEEEIKTALEERVVTVDNFYQFILNQPSSILNIVNFDEDGHHALYVRNFIIIAKDKATLDKITRKILDAQPLFNVP